MGRVGSRSLGEFLNLIMSFSFMKCDKISQFRVTGDGSIGDVRKQESSETVITESGKVNLLGTYRQLWLY